MRLILEEYGLIVIAVVIAAVFFFTWSRFVNEDGNIYQIYQSGVGWNSEYKSKLLRNATYDGDYLKISDLGSLRGVVDDLYVAGLMTDLHDVRPPKISCGGAGTTVIPEGVTCMRDTDWIGLLDLSVTDAPDGMKVLVEEYSTLTLDTAQAVPNNLYGKYFYKDSAIGYYREYNPATDALNTVTLYEIIERYDVWGNNIQIDGTQKIPYITKEGNLDYLINNSGVEYTFDIAWYMDRQWGQSDISAGVVISTDVPKKYKVMFRAENCGLKAQYTALCFNTVRPTVVSFTDEAALDSYLDSLFDMIYTVTSP